MPRKHPPTRCYYVDEAGDSTIYGKGGRSLLSSEGVSQYFMLGFLDVAEPENLSDALTSLRLSLLNDKYFANIPSMQSINNKTAAFFHAKDDLPEIRYEVFKLLRNFSGLKFYAVVRTKASVMKAYEERNQKYDQNVLYDDMARRLFHQHLHKGSEFRICFAKRGNSDRTEALKLALETARRDAEVRWNVQNNSPLQVSAVMPVQEVCLQACDYLLWALQRLYERKEERYFLATEHLHHLILDQDDTRKNPYGIYYKRNNPLRVSKLPQ